jgi:hypothetical protein
MKWTTVSCSDCGVTWSKNADSLKVWQGRCRSCAYKKRWQDPAYKEPFRERTRQQVLAQGGVPNARKFYEGMVGEKHPLWKGGKTPPLLQGRSTNAYRRWAQAVKEKDYFTCQHCGSSDGKLHVHHLQSWLEHPELRFEVSNGQTLCASCHGSESCKKRWQRRRLLD